MGNLSGCSLRGTSPSTGVWGLGEFWGLGLGFWVEGVGLLSRGCSLGLGLGFLGRGFRVYGLESCFSPQACLRCSRTQSRPFSPFRFPYEP